MSTTEGARLAGALIEAMMSHLMAHARHSAEELSFELQKGCPDFFGADSRTFYHARDLLQLARDARARKENIVRDKHVNDAIAFFMKVPTAGDLSSVCAELVDLRAFHGVTAVPLAAAAALEARSEEARFSPHEQPNVDMVVRLNCSRSRVDVHLLLHVAMKTNHLRERSAYRRACSDDLKLQNI